MSRTRRVCASPACSYTRSRADFRLIRTLPPRRAGVLVLHNLAPWATRRCSRRSWPSFKEKWATAEIVLACPKSLISLYRSTTVHAGVDAVPFDPRDENTLLEFEEFNGFDIAYIPPGEPLQPIGQGAGQPLDSGL